MPDGSDGKLQSSSDGGMIATHPDPDPFELIVAPSTSDEFNTARLRLIPIACFRIDDVRFRFDSSFVLPQVQGEISAFAKLRKQDPRFKGAPISIFGHADPSYQGNFEPGSSTAASGDDYNKVLSGRRAIAIYAMLVRDPSLWDALFSNKLGGDEWGELSIRIMLFFLDQQNPPAPNAQPDPNAAAKREAEVHDTVHNSGKRKQLFLKYMDLLCGDFKLDKSADFLARSAGPDLKGDVQGCGRFNPLVLFSSEDEQLFKDAFNKKDTEALRTERDSQNGPNRRVMILVFRKGSQILPSRWPCPTYKEGPAACKKRFFPNGDELRSTHLAGAQKTFDETHDTFACRFYQRISDRSPCHAPGVVPAIFEVKAKIASTHGKRKPKKIRPENLLTPSVSSDESLEDNPPVALVRGCNEVQLQAVTTPPDMPVDWSVKPNENDESAPTITPIGMGQKATLKTDKQGSFSVIATSGASKIVWNVVFVWVKVDPASSIKTTRDLYKDAGSNATFASFESGEFLPAKFTWEASVKVKLIGGGKDKTLGIDEIRLGVLQNGVKDTLTGHYSKGGTCLEVPHGGLPVVDSNGDADISPLLINPDSFSITPDNTSDTRTVWTGDSPTGAFDVWHRDGKEFLTSVSGVNGFETAVASFSTNARGALCLHAKMAWEADYLGKISYPPPKKITHYTANGAHTKSQAEFVLISEATGGQDAQEAGFETFEPRFNAGTDKKFTP
jgi:hypothetical protein